MKLQLIFIYWFCIMQPCWTQLLILDLLGYFCFLCYWFFLRIFLCARSYHLQIGSFISCAPIWRNFLSFSWLNSWAQFSVTILNWSIKNWHPWFVPCLTEKAFHLSWISRCWLWVLHRCSLSWWQSFHLFLV